MPRHPSMAYSGTPIQIYNSMKREKEVFVRDKGETITMYTCGPTVYKPTHIGHMVGPIVFDTLKRYLVFLGYKVKWALNITDVDDNIIEAAKEKKVSTKELAASMTAEYKKSLDAVNVTGIDYMPAVTDNIKPIIAMIHALVTKGAAYTANGSVYFDTSKVEDYGKLCNRDKSMMVSNKDEYTKYKKNLGDFALWKEAKSGELEACYESVFGCGRPGWHIECSCMLKQLFGDTVDIHGGGHDLQFPHHENEIAQSETVSGKQLARVWMHHGLIRNGSVKMSGSLGNYIRVTDLVRRYPGDVIRLFVLSTHYRSPFDIGFIKDGIPAAISSTAAAYNTFVRINERIQLITGKKLSDSDYVKPTADFADIQRRFFEYLADDFNTANAVAVAFEVCNRLNRLADRYKLNTNTPESVGEFKEGVSVFRMMMNILGLTLKPFTPQKEMTAELLDLLLKVRNCLKDEAKLCVIGNPAKPVLFTQADQIRTRLYELGVNIEDDAAGGKWRYM
jgi:cysteinyl-tRNA synthetase